MAQCTHPLERGCSNVGMIALVHCSPLAMRDLKRSTVACFLRRDGAREHVERAVTPDYNRSRKAREEKRKKKSQRVSLSALLYSLMSLACVCACLHSA